MKLREAIKNKIRTWLNIREELDPFNIIARRQKVLSSKERDDQDQVRRKKVEYSLYLWETNPIAEAALEYLIAYILGKGLQYSTEQDLLKERLDDFWKENNMEIQHIEIVRAGFLEGELFLHFPKVEIGQTPAIIPIDSNEIIYIARNPDDYRKVDYYHREYKVIIYSPITDNKSFGYAKEEIRYENIPAEEIIHFKFNSLPNLSRGRGYLHRVQGWLDEYKLWLEGRNKLNKAKGAFAWVFKLATDNPADISAWQEKINDFATYDKNGNVIDTIPAGQPVVLGKNMELESPGPSINASGASEDGRQIKLMSAVGMRLPEFMLSDGANANLATTTSQMSPMIKSMEMQQEMIRLLFVSIFNKVIDMYMQIPGALPEFFPIEEIDEGGNVVVDLKSPKELYTLSFPELAISDVSILSRPLVDLVTAEVLSREQANEALGYDWEKTKKLIDQEKAAGYKAPQPQPFGGTSSFGTGLAEAMDKKQLGEIAKLNKDCAAELKANFKVFEENLKNKIPNAKDIFISHHQEIVKKYLEQGTNEGYAFHANKSSQ